MLFTADDIELFITYSGQAREFTVFLHGEVSGTWTREQVTELRDLLTRLLDENT